MELLTAQASNPSPTMDTPLSSHEQFFDFLKGAGAGSSRISRRVPMSKKHWWEGNPQPDFDSLYEGLKEEDARVGRDFFTYHGEIDDSGAELLKFLLEAPFCALGIGIVASGFLVYLSLSFSRCLIESSPFLVETLHGSRLVTQPSSSISSTSSPQSSAPA